MPPAKIILMSSVFGSIMLMSFETNGEYFRVKSDMIIPGLQHFSRSNGFAPTGTARASLNAISMVFEGRGAGWTHRVLSGARSLVPPN